MSDKLDLEIQYSVEDYVRGLTFVQNRQFLSKYALIIVPSLLIVLFLLIFVLNPDSTNQMSLPSVLVTIFPIFAIFGLLLFLKYFPNPILRRHVQKQFNSSPIMQEQQLITIDETGIKGKTNLSAGETYWAAIIEATETKNDLFFFTSSKFAMFVPKGGLSIKQIEDIKELARSNLGEKANF